MIHACNVCGDKLEFYIRTAKDTLTRDSFSVARCIRCGLGHTLPRPDDMGRYYVSPYYGNRHGVTLNHCMKRRLKFVSCALGGNMGGNLLDIGCGDGSFLLMAKKHGWKVTGTELNPLPARECGLDVKASTSEIFEDGGFQCVTMWHSLEHMRDVASMFTDVSRLLSADGRLVISVPDFGGLQAKLFREHWLHLDVPRHIYHFNGKALAYALKQAGFRIERRWHQEFEYDLLGWSQSALNRFMGSHPNLFMNLLAGKGGEGGSLVRASALFSGLILTLLSIPLLLLGTLMGRGGSLVVVAKRK
jgi:2-polyprenyl-3-methyl-5-hydroxy-6-metoxy-1,4-benzoquinol methylase